MNAQTMQLVDIYDVWYQPWWHSLWIYVALGIIVCSVLFFVLYYMYRAGFFRKNLSYDQQALKDLSVLSAQVYLSDEKIRAAYFQITMILKKYLGQRYQISLHDKSDIEIISLLHEQIHGSLQPLLAEFLQRSFQIKFAKDGVSEQMLRDDILFVKKIIEQTASDHDKVGNS